MRTLLAHSNSTLATSTSSRDTTPNSSAATAAKSPTTVACTCWTEIRSMSGGPLGLQPHSLPFTPHSLQGARCHTLLPPFPYPKISQALIPGKITTTPHTCLEPNSPETMLATSAPLLGAAFNSRIYFSTFCSGFGQGSLAGNSPLTGLSRSALQLPAAQTTHLTCHVVHPTAQSSHMGGLHTLLVSPLASCSHPPLPGSVPVSVLPSTHHSLCQELP